MYVGLDVSNAGRGQKAVDGRACGAGMYSLSIAPDGTVYPLQLASTAGWKSAFLINTRDLGAVFGIAKLEFGSSV